MAPPAHAPINNMGPIAPAGCPRPRLNPEMHNFASAKLISNIHGNCPVRAWFTVSYPMPIMAGMASANRPFNRPIIKKRSQILFGAFCAVFTQIQINNAARAPMIKPSASKKGNSNNERICNGGTVNAGSAP